MLIHVRAIGCRGNKAPSAASPGTTLWSSFFSNYPIRIISANYIGIIAFESLSIKCLSCKIICFTIRKACNNVSCLAFVNIFTFIAIWRVKVYSPINNIMIKIGLGTGIPLEFNVSSIDGSREIE